MIVYLNADGTIQQVVPQTLTQGSNNENLIVVGANISNYTSLSAIFKLPSGQILTPILMTKQDSNYVINDEIVNVWICQITKSITNFSGLLELTIKARTNNIDMNSYIGTVQIAPANAPTFPSIDETSEEIFNQIADAYSYISGQLLSKQDIYDNNLETEDKTVVGAINELVQTIAEFDAGQVSIEEFEELQNTVSDLIPDVARALKTPIVRPTETKLVGVDNTNSQTMVDLREDFKVENYTLKLTGANISNPNLLINGDFRVNQRGQTIYSRTSGRVYTADRWGIWSNNCKFNIETKTLTNLVTSGNAIMSQYIEDSEALFGKTLTLSANINNTIYTVTGTVANSYDNATSDTVILIKEISNMYYIRVTWDNSRKKIRVDIGCTPTGNNITIKYVKLEIGSVATAFSPRPYADELAMCQRYYQRIRVNGAMGFVGNVNILYSGVSLIQTMRATPTVTNEVQTSVREIGKGIKGNVDLLFNYLYDNILQISADTSSLGLTLYSGCVLVNGTLVLEAEF